jgi:hypothetical protein
MEEGARYCAACGAYQEEEYCYRQPLMPHEILYAYDPEIMENEGRLPLACMLAYIPGLFFIPLLSEPHDNIHRKCASQGVWITLISIVGVLLLPYLVITGNQMHLFTLQYLVSLFTGWNMVSWPRKLWHLFLLYWIMLPLGCYVPMNSLRGFFRGTFSRIPYRIPLFWRFQLFPLSEENENVEVSDD